MKRHSKKYLQENFATHKNQSGFLNDYCKQIELKYIKTPIDLKVKTFNSYFREAKWIVQVLKTKKKCCKLKYK